MTSQVDCKLLGKTFDFLFLDPPRMVKTHNGFPRILPMFALLLPKRMGSRITMPTCESPLQNFLARGPYVSYLTSLC